MKLIDNGRFPLPDKYVIALRMMTSWESAYSNNGNPMIQYIISGNSEQALTSSDCNYQCSKDNQDIVLSIPLKDIFYIMAIWAMID